MNVLHAEGIKLTTLRSTWWCLAAAPVLALVFAGGFTAAARQSGTAVTIATSQTGRPTAMMAILVLAATFVASEYRFGTIKTSFIAVPGRAPVLIAKAAITAIAAGAAGVVTAFAAWAFVAVLAPGGAPALDTEPALRAVAGTGLVFAIAAVIATAVAALVRTTAAAVAIVLLEPILLDRIIGLIPIVGPRIQPWMPFTAAENFLAAGNPKVDGGQFDPATLPYHPWLAAAYAVAAAIVLLLLAIKVTQSRDA
ncbi:hypothetical protein [Fodinicola acaciae]|uniref:hypothetical protein n=1 Tax=Fodinicola acaciae TaxID=2681555 RepID=UPI0013D50971|nr:hypothetical protein [Fodinicola acaciae]